MREPERLTMTRIVATPAALDALPSGGLRLAPDEMLLFGETAPPLSDPHAIIAAETGFVGLRLPADEASRLLERTCQWEPPAQRPAFAQGMVAGLPLKLWFEADSVLFITPAPFGADLAERLR